MTDDRRREGEDGGIVRRRISPDPETSEYDFLEIIARLEGCEIADLPSLYDQVAHSVEYLFRDPPATEAQMEVAFSYAGYRVRIDQRGQLEILTVKDSLEEP